MGFHVKEWIASIATHDCASRSHFKELGRTEIQSGTTFFLSFGSLSFSKSDPPR